MPTLVLASTSPRRRQLMTEAGLDFIAVSSPAEEWHDESIDHISLCRHNALAKAAAVAPEYPEAIVIGADTLVSLDGIPLGKPRDEADAFAMLMRLNGRSNEVCTAVCLCLPDGAQHVFHEISTVYFHQLDEAAIRHYMTLVHTLDKAGGYAAQEHKDLIIDRTEGDFTNIIGLPMARLIAELRLHGA
jgi:septum formation protein